MERRLLTFIVASTAFFFFYISMRVMFGPPPQRPAAAAKRDAAEVEAPPVGEAAGAELAEAAGEEPAEDGQQATDPERLARPQWLTLGSMDPQSEHLLLVTLNSRGAGVERIELTERAGGRLKYRRVDVRYGYLGYFAGEPTETGDGVLVNVVGPGTPAALATSATHPSAKIQPGDIIVAVANKAVATPADIEKALISTKPNDEISVEVLRAVTGAENPGAENPVVENPDAAPTSMLFKAKLTEHPLDLVRLAKFGGADQIAGNLSRLSCLLTLGQVNSKSIAVNDQAITGIANPAELNWTSEAKQVSGNDIAEFMLDLSAADLRAAGGGPVRLRRSYVLAPGSYAIDMSIQLENRSEATQQLGYRLEGANGLTLEGWWYSNKISPNFSGAAARDIVYKTKADGHELISGYALLKQARKDPQDADQTIFAPDGDAASRNLKYIGVDAQYFTVAYLAPSPDSSLTRFRRATAGIVADKELVAKHKDRAVNVSFFLDSVVADVPAGASLSEDIRMFAGPKQPELLEQYALSDCVYYGWFWFVAIPLAHLLHWLSGVGNYAVAIILLTVIVRACMFPLSRKAAVNAQRMQELAPEFKKIAEKYKDDMEGRMKAQRELQKRVGFNPMAGCLPMFLQLPIFIGLYRALSVDIELRQAAVSNATGWASNLAGPDMLAYWGEWLWDYMSGRGTGWLGPYFNILPVIVVVLFLLQQKMFMPPATDEQTRMTQKMMNYMTLAMGLFFFRVPAGLCIYFITSSLWGICERILVKKTLPAAKHFDPAVLDGTATATATESASAPKESIADRIRQQMTKPEATVQRPSQRPRPKQKKKR